LANELHAIKPECLSLTDRKVEIKMKHFGLTRAAISGGLFLAAFIAPAVHADEWDKKTTLTFSDPVQVPGMTLPAGTYVFRLADTTADRAVVQIFNKNEDHIFTTLLAIPNYRLITPEKTIITFYEATSGQPQPVKAWFYPGDNFGRQFVYGKSEAAMMAGAANETVLSGDTTVASAPQPAAMPAPVQTTTTDQSSTTAAQSESAQPAAPPVAVASVEPTPAQPAAELANDAPPAIASTVDQSSGTPAPVPAQTTLPSTASSWPLVGLLGLSSILCGFTLRAARRLS
jgi:hypothetical protein